MTLKFNMHVEHKDKFQWCIRPTIYNHGNLFYTNLRQYIASLKIYIAWLSLKLNS